MAQQTAANCGSFSATQQNWWASMGVQRTLSNLSPKRPFLSLDVFSGDKIARIVDCFSRNPSEIWTCSILWLKLCGWRLNLQKWEVESSSISPWFRYNMVSFCTEPWISGKKGARILTTMTIINDLEHLHCTTHHYTHIHTFMYTVYLHIIFVLHILCAVCKYICIYIYIIYIFLYVYLYFNTCKTILICNSDPGLTSHLPPFLESLEGWKVLTPRHPNPPQVKEMEWKPYYSMKRLYENHEAMRLDYLGGTHCQDRAQFSLTRG